MTTVFVALGANLNEPLARIRAARQALQALATPGSLRHARLYRSRPMGPADQPDYLNSVSVFDTELAPHALLDALQAIEQREGRVRKDERWGPRALDLDLLLYGEQRIDDERLTVPHYGMKQREFVLYPLADLAPGLVLPCGTSLSSLLQQCPLNGMLPLPEQ
ncbi:2-amino-4-hydroxy-6-hydroxymethyldihydropteridine pyrophosphokinase [Oceanimonas sp. GK1]|uniref:2-amino-4-hydroxy-6- hydroxymethyldihydropteridine diphosphokinase n=1 Tax=Oceanimonas sp. (strain GK1 / IBRC-M 10197) TaxID=511062 RepID=UPI0002494C41|nr:2-amino-4-hydroxy-6-hydroxymethyldihydropteridine diphosphokinase [Oceanimonas sp. GK1]AEY00518.1 2-amino-4-hydroxy-6-hydroxymethyldihydropteridine pyrophosphokinase [Oceanimonas sp. GK1]